SAVGEAELRYGAALLPTGRRRESLVSDIEAMLRDAFDDRVLPFDSRAARACAAILACSPRHAGVRKRLPRVRQGRPRMTPTFEPLAGSVREILCLREERVVGNDNTGARPRVWRCRSRRHHFVKAKVRVHECPDGTRAGPSCLAREPTPIETPTRKAA
ncbi:MAG: hypothetical protein OXD42_08715, partial [Rhodospirillaceae bacterium]|nr:hypothetical protein [Rhodospirillaceae bacterium]